MRGTKEYIRNKLAQEEIIEGYNRNMWYTKDRQYKNIEKLLNTKDKSRDTKDKSRNTRDKQRK